MIMLGVTAAPYPSVLRAFAGLLRGVLINNPFFRILPTKKIRVNFLFNHQGGYAVVRLNELLARFNKQGDTDMGKKEAMWRYQLQRAVNKVRDEANGLHDFDRGVQSGASMVAFEFYEIQRRDAALKEDGIDPGSP